MAEFKLGRIRFVWQGAWTDGASYTVDDVVNNGGQSYICKITHTASALFNTDLTTIPTKWELVSGGNLWKNNWASTTYYDKNDIVKNGGVVYLCKTPHESQTIIEDDLDLPSMVSSKWDIFATSFNWRGAWSDSQDYLYYDVVSYGGIVYICNTTHTSGSLLEDDSGNWDVVNSGFTYTSTWSGSSVYYKLNDIAKYGADLWICTSPHTSSASFDTEKWTIFVNGLQFESSWNNSTVYQPGDTVTYGGYSYIAKTVHSDSQPTANPFDWDLFTTGFKFVGDWTLATDYLVGNVVRNGGYTYVALQNSTASGSNKPGDYPSYWSQLNSGLNWTNSTVTYTALAGTNLIGSGSSATFDVIRTGAVYSVTKNNAGTGYATSDKVKILGSNLGGTSPANDLTITITGQTGGVIDTISWIGNSITWKSGITYILGDIVLYGASSYICVSSHTASSGNRPDADTTATYWNLLTAGAEASILTTSGDTLYYGPTGATRLPIGQEGQVLRVTSGYPAWRNYGVINNAVYVGPLGTDSPAPLYGLTIDKPFKTVRYAAEQIEKGYLNPNATELLAKNKQFILKEVSNYVSYTYKATVSGTSSGAFTTTNTANINVGMPIRFSNLTGSLTVNSVALGTTTTYYVKTIVTNTSFTIAASYGGSTITAAGTGTATASYYTSLSSEIERDAGLVLDAIIYDIGHGGTGDTTTAALAYLNSAGTDYYNTSINYQKTQFIGALNYLVTTAQTVLANGSPVANYQSLNSATPVAYQIVDSTLTAETGTSTSVSTLTSLVTAVLTYGNSSAIPTAVQPTTTISVKTGTYSEVLPIVIPKYTAVVGDELRSTVIQPKPANTLLVNDKPKTVAVLQRMQSIVSTLVANGSVSATSGNTQTQVTTLPAGSAGSTAAANSVRTSVGLIRDILTNGLPQVPAFVLPNPTSYNTSLTNTAYASTGNATGSTANYGDGKGQFVQNYQYIQDEMSAYLTVYGTWTSYTALRKLDTLRDTRFILDAIQYDMTYGGNNQTLIVASSYYSNNIIQLTGIYLAETLLGLARLKVIIGQIVTKTSVTPTAGNTTTQVTTGTAGSAGAATFAQERVQDIIDYINNAVATTTTAPYYGWVASDLQDSFAALQASRTEISTDAMLWVKKFYQSTTFNTTLTSRDATLIVDAVSYDLLFGSNFASAIAGRRYQSLASSAVITATTLINETNGSLNFIAYKAAGIAAAGAAAKVSSDIDNMISTIRGTVTTTLTTATTSTNVLTVTSTTGMYPYMRIRFTGLPADISTTASATAVSTNLITLGATVASLGIAVNQPIYFTGTVFGNIVPNQKYYVKTASASSITVSLTIGGTAVSLVNGSGTMTVKVNNAGGLYNNKDYWIATVTSTTTITITNTYKSVSSITIGNTVTSMTATVSAGLAAEIYGTNSYNNDLGTIKGAEIIRANKTFLAYEATAYATQSYGGTVTTTTATTDRFTTSGNHNLTVGDPVVFSGTNITGSGITIGTTYYVLAVPTTSTFTLTATAGSSTAVNITSDGTGSMTVRYAFDEASCRRDMLAYVDAFIYDLNFVGNYKTQRATTIYLNAVAGSLLSNMFFVRNATGLRNCTMSGLSGTLTAANSFGTKRPTAGAFTSLDPGFGPADTKVWITTRSHYSQNCTMFGTACTGAKIDASLHNGGNKSMVKNDYTTILSDGIGVWCTGSGSLTELVSVFNYYGYSGYIAELGGRIRATNGNSSYGTYGTIAEGVDSYETPLYATLDNRAAEAQIGQVLTDGVNQIWRFEYTNAGQNYTNTVHTISAAGYNATTIADEFRDYGVTETRLVDLNDGNGYGGTSYLTAANVAQTGSAYAITIAATDAQLATAYTGMRLLITTGTGAGQYGSILSYSNGSKIALMTKESFTTLTVTATSTTNNLLTVASTASLYAGMGIYLSGTMTGTGGATGLSANQLYYINSANFSGTQFQVSLSPGGSGTAVTISNNVTALTIGVYAAGFDHVVPGTTSAAALDLTTGYIIEPKITYSAPGYTATARTLQSSTAWSSAAYAAGNFVAITSSGTATNYSTSGTSWTSGGALPTNTTWAGLTYLGGEGATSTVVIGGFGGSGAVLTATLGSANALGNPLADQVLSVTVVNGGYNYTTPPTIVFTSATGSGAVGVATVLNGIIQAVTVTVPGSGYATTPTVAARTDIVSSYTINSYGKNYGVSTTTVTITDPFSGTIWSSGGSSTSGNYYYYVNGSDKNWYRASNSATFGGSGPVHTSGTVTNGSVNLVYAGTTARGTASFTNTGVSSISLDQAGSGYTAVPTLTILDTNARFVAVKTGGGAASAYSKIANLASAWTLSSVNQPAGTYAATASSGSIVVAIGGTGTAASTPDGDSWTSRTIASLGAGTWSAVTYGNGTFVAISTGNNVTSYSTNGIVWTAGGNLPASTTWTSVAYGNGRFVAIASGGRSVAYSLDKGVTWVAANPGMPSSQAWTTVRYGQGLFFAVATSATVGATSPDGINWTSVAMPGSSTNWTGLAFGNPSSNPIWVATSATSGTTAASMITGATAQGRAKVAANVITEIRMAEPGSGYPRGNVSSIAASNVINTTDTTNLIDSQPIEFTGLDSYGLTTNVTYYVIGSQIVSNASFKVSATAGSATAVTLTATSTTGTYKAGPIVTQVDPNKVKTAATRPRMAVGVLGTPTFSNRGTANTTASASTLGDGYGDLYQPSNFISVANLFGIPQAGANVQFASITGTSQWYKLVAVTNILGTAGNQTATFQINPSLTVYNAPAHGDVITTRIKYSQVRLTGHDFLYIGTGNFASTNYPYVNAATAIQANQTLGSGGGRVFFTSTDQDGNFNVGNLFGVQQATGTATLNASAFNLSGLQSLQLGSVAVGTGSATVTQFSTDPYFTANSDNILPTQRAIKSYITAQIGGGQSSLNVNTLTAGVIYIANNTITTTSNAEIKVTAKMNFTGGIDGAPVAFAMFLTR